MKVIQSLQEKTKQTVSDRLASEFKYLKKQTDSLQSVPEGSGRVLAIKYITG